MSREDLALVDRAFEALARGDYAAAIGCYAPDVEFMPLRSATEGVFRGHAGLERFLADTLESFETFEPHYELRDLGAGRVLAWGTIHVRGSGSGVEMDIPTGGIFDVRNGKIVRWQDFGSKEKALEAVGLRE